MPVGSTALHAILHWGEISKHQWDNTGGWLTTTVYWLDRHCVKHARVVSMSSHISVILSGL